MQKSKLESWVQHIAGWKESGQSKAEFCRQAGLHYQKFCYHCRRVKITSSAENAFVALGPAQLSTALTCDTASNDIGKPSGIRLYIGSVGVELDCGFCSKTLLALLCLLEE